MSALISKISEKLTESTKEIRSKISNSSKLPKIGVVNGGGDCPGLNTVIDAIVRYLHPNYQILGFYKSFDGLKNKDFVELNPSFTARYRFTGGTFLKSVSKGDFSGKIDAGGKKTLDKTLLSNTKKAYDELGLECLIVLGGDGTMATAQQFFEAGMNIIGVPKSIDNDLDKTDLTFGFQTAVEIATEALDRLETTAYSHDRVMILEVMGRNAGWIALHSGLAGGANVILLPEIESNFESVAKFLQKREKKNALIVVSEGIKNNQDNQKQFTVYQQKDGEQKLGGAGQALADYLNQNNQFEARSTTLGHIQRGGTPGAFDRLLSHNFGAYAASLVEQKNYGKLVVYQKGSFTTEPIKNCIECIKQVDPNHFMINQAKQMGVFFGE